MNVDERVDCFTLVVFPMYCDCWRSTALPHGAVGWSEVCDCGFPDHTHLLCSMETASHQRFGL